MNLKKVSSEGNNHDPQEKQKKLEKRSLSEQRSTIVQTGPKDIQAGHDVNIGKIIQKVFNFVFEPTINFVFPFNSQHGRFVRYVAIGVYTTFVIGGFINLKIEGYASLLNLSSLIIGGLLLTLTCFYYACFWDGSIPSKTEPPRKPSEPQDFRFWANPNAKDPEREEYRVLDARQRYREKYEEELAIRQQREQKYEHECKQYEHEEKRRKKALRRFVIRRLLAAILMVFIPFSVLATFWTWWSTPTNTIVTLADYFVPQEDGLSGKAGEITAKVSHHLESEPLIGKGKDIEIKRINKPFKEGEGNEAKREAQARRATVSIWGQYTKSNPYTQDMTINAMTFFAILKRPLDLLLPDEVRGLYEQTYVSNNQLYSGYDGLQLAEVNLNVKESVKNRLNEPKHEELNLISQDIEYITNFVSGIAHYKAGLDYKRKNLEIAQKHLHSAIERLQKSLERLESIKKHPLGLDAQLLDKQIVLKFLESINAFYRGNAYVYDASFSKAESGYDLAINSFTRAIEFISDYVLSSDNRQIIYPEQYGYRTALVSYILEPQYQLSLNERDDDQEFICGSKKRDEDVFVGNSPDQLRIFLSRIYNNRGVAYAMKGDIEKALADYKRAIRFDPEIDEVCVNLGNAYFDMGKYNPAIKNYGKAISDSTGPEDGTAYNNLGNVYMMQGEYQQAIKQYEQAIALDQNSADAYYNRGRAYLFWKKDNGGQAQANQDLNRATQLNPNFAEVYYYGRGKDDFARQDYAQSSTNFQAAIKAKPNFAEAHAREGESYFNQGRYSSALRSFNKAIELKPKIAIQLESRISEASSYATVKIKNSTDYEIQVTASNLDNGSLRKFSISPRSSLVVEDLKPGRYKFKPEAPGSDVRSFESGDVDLTFQEGDIGSIEFWITRR